MSKRPIPGVAYLFIASTIFAFTSLCVKFASHYFSGLFISMARFAIGAILCTIVLFIKKPHYDWARVRIILIRGFIGALSMISSYLAISLTSPGRASLLSNTYPVFVGIFGALFFHEKLSPRILVSLALCTIGTISVVRDNSGASLAGDIVALGGAVFSGIAVNFVRKASAGGVDPFTIYLSPCTFGLAIFAIFARSEAFGVPEDGMNGIGILLLVLIGTGAFVAQAFMAKGYETVPANKGSIVFYWETALTIALGAIFTGEVLNFRFLVGLAFIMAGLWANSTQIGAKVRVAKGH